MIGKTVERPTGGRAWTVCLLLAAILATGNFVTKQHHLLLLSVAPFAIACTLLLMRKRPFVFHFADEGIEVLSPHQEFISYDRIEALCFHEDDRRRNNRSFPFVIVYAEGTLEIPAGLKVPSHEIFRFLKAMLTDDLALSPPVVLQGYLRKHDREFGEDRVWTYRALPDPDPAQNWLGVVMFGVLGVVGLVWLVYGVEAKGEYEPWAGIGGLTFTFCLLGLFVSSIWGSGANRGRRIRDGGLIISPVGFALKQGSLCGQMRWDEVTDIEFRRPSYIICVSFIGGTIVLRDIFDRSLRDIFHRFLDYWEEPLDD